MVYVPTAGDRTEFGEGGRTVRRRRDEEDRRGDGGWSHADDAGSAGMASPRSDGDHDVTTRATGRQAASGGSHSRTEATGAGCNTDSDENYICVTVP
jgi:hypothetical protein